MRCRSDKSGYACPDGEIETAFNLKVAEIADLSSDTGSSSDTGFSSDTGSDSDSDSDSSSGTGSGGSLSREPVAFSLPPAPEVEFALKRVALDGWNIHPDIFPSQIVEKGEETEAGWGKMAMQLLNRFEKDVKNQNLFFEPFLVIAALRLTDGTRVMPSPPVLMIPNSGAPVVSGTDNFSVDTMKLDLVAAVCSLQWRVRLPEDLKKYKEVSHLEILVSDPLPLYSRNEAMTGCHRMECMNFSHSIASDGTSREHRVASATIVQGWQPVPVTEAESLIRLRDALKFRPVSELPVESLSSSVDFEDVGFNCGGLSMSGAYEAYIPDYAHRSAVTGAAAAVVSGRVTAWDLTLVAPLPVPLGMSAPYSTDSGYRPRWVFHPDPEAREYLFSAGDKTFAVPLKRHPRLYGSYYWRGMEGEDTAMETVPATPSQESRTVRLPSEVWRSEKGLGILFPDRLLMRLDVGRVIAVCRAFRASGLVATTSPTVYAFTTDGVFLLKEMDDGTLRDAGLICSYVLRDAGSYEVKGRSVEFVTAEGEVMTIDGTTVKEKSGVAAGNSTSAMSGIAMSAVDTGATCRLTTRPVKLGDAESLKRVVAVKLRGDFDPGRCRLSLYGSMDLRNWKKIADAPGRAIVGIWSPRCRFHKVEAELHLGATETLQGFAISISEPKESSRPINQENQD